MSTMRFMSATHTAATSTTPVIAGKSWLLAAVTA